MCTPVYSRALQSTQEHSRALQEQIVTWEHSRGGGYAPLALIALIAQEHSRANGSLLSVFVTKWRHSRLMRDRREIHRRRMRGIFPYLFESSVVGPAPEVRVCMCSVRWKTFGKRAGERGVHVLLEV